MRTTTTTRIPTRAKKRSAVGCGPFPTYPEAISVAHMRQRRAPQTADPGQITRRPIFAILKRNGYYLVYSNHAYAMRMSLLRRHDYDPALLGTPVAYVLASGALYEL